MLEGSVRGRGGHMTFFDLRRQRGRGGDIVHCSHTNGKYCDCENVVGII